MKLQFRTDFINLFNHANSHIREATEKSMPLKMRVSSFALKFYF